MATETLTLVSHSLSLLPVHRSFIWPRPVPLLMNRADDGKESIQTAEVIDVLRETPLSSLRKTGRAPVRTSHGLVRLASSTGRVETPAWSPSEMTRRRPDWRSLRMRAGVVKTSEVVG